MTKMARDRGVFSAAVMTTAMVLAFKLLGFVKQMVIAYYFGATQSTDIYFVASEFVSGIAEAIVHAISFSTLSVYTAIRIREGREKSDELMSALFSILAPLSVIIVTLFQLFAPQLAVMLAPAYSPDQRLELVGFIRLMSFMFMFVAFELLCCAVLDSEKKFTIPRLKSLFLSAFVIVFCVFLSERLGIVSLAIGQYAANVVYLGFLLAGVRKYVKLRFANPHRCPHVKKILLMAVPLFIGNGIIQINQIVDKALATGLGSGITSALTYCHVLAQFVTSVMIVNIGNVLFAHFSNHVAMGEKDKIQRTLNSALAAMVYILVPISLVTIFCADEIVRIIYFRGDFSAEAVRLTALALVGYAISFAFVGVRDILTKSMYAYQDTRSPMINSSAGILLNIVTSVILSRYIGILGIALGTSISAAVSMLLNMRSFKKKLPEFSYRNTFGALLRCVPGALAMCGIIMLVKRAVNNDLVCFILAAFVSGGVFCILLYVIGAPEIRRLVSAMKRRLLRERT